MAWRIGSVYETLGGLSNCDEKGAGAGLFEVVAFFTADAGVESPFDLLGGVYVGLVEKPAFPVADIVLPPRHGCIDAGWGVCASSGQP